MSVSPACSFRIIGLTESELTTLIERHLTGVEHRKGSDHKDKSKKLLRIILDERADVELLRRLLRDSPSDVYHDFFVSVSSREETAVIEVPEFVLALHAKVGGKFCFSYTCVS